MSTILFISRTKDYTCHQSSRCRSDTNGTQGQDDVLYSIRDDSCDVIVATRSIWHRLSVDPSRELRLGLYCMHRISFVGIEAREPKLLNYIRSKYELSEPYRYGNNRKTNYSYYIYCS